VLVGIVEDGGREIGVVGQRELRGSGVLTHARILAHVPAQPPGTRSTRPLIDMIDESFVYAEPGQVAERLREQSLLRRWWPDLDLAVFQDRGEAGMRWTVTGSLVGTSEIWLEPADDGVLVHYYVRADPTRPGSRTEPVTGSPRRRAWRGQRLAARHAKAFKQSVWALKDELEAGRAPGVRSRKRTSRPTTSR
jgi:hypothetical protein